MDGNKSSSTKELPTGINVVNHISSRIKELKKLYNDVASKKSEMLIHQMLPNRMRRRAMSHNPKRMPTKYRKIHISQMSKSAGWGEKKKRPSRRYRRKANNLLKEYNRRKQKNTWLETHIWHAKRFKMSNLWGYRIPFKPTNKVYRASYKAVRSYCLLEDNSFYGCIAVSGDFELLKKEFHRLTSDFQPSLTAKCFVTGSREGRVNIFKADACPLGAIANVRFLWNAADEVEKSVWLFVHPAAYEELLTELKNLFLTIPRSNEKSNILTRNPQHENSETGVKIIELKDTLNRFRLSGSLASVIISKALKPTNNGEKNWLLDEKNQKYAKAHHEQIKMWEKLKSYSSTEFPPHCVINLNIEDPRTNRFITTKLTKDEEILPQFYREIIIHSSEHSLSPMWNKDLRDNLINSMVTTGELCKLRNQKQLVPTIASSFEMNLQPLPILIIQRPGIESNNFGAGWDLIVPAGYGLSVWLNLIKFGAKPGGWEQHKMMASEMGNTIFSPDTAMARKEAENAFTNAREKYFKKPPNKRTNFRKISIASPFKAPYEQLIEEWGGSAEKFHLLRNPAIFSKIECALKSRVGALELNLDSSSLIPIRVNLLSRGYPEEMSIVCLPNKEDIQNKFNTPIANEKHVNDPFEGARKNLRFSHKKELKRLRNKRVREKRRRQKDAENFVKITKSNTGKINEEHFNKMCKLWLPSNSNSIRHQCSREVIGYLTDSKTFFSCEKISARGYVASVGLIELLRLFNKIKVKPFVLIRSPHGTAYYAASIDLKFNTENDE